MFVVKQSCLCEEKYKSVFPLIMLSVEIEWYYFEDSPKLLLYMFLALIGWITGLTPIAITDKTKYMLENDEVAIKKGNLCCIKNIVGR